jgi:hypothetical protein
MRFVTRRLTLFSIINSSVLLRALSRDDSFYSQFSLRVPSCVSPRDNPKFTLKLFIIIKHVA